MMRTWLVGLGLACAAAGTAWAAGGGTTWRGGYQYGYPYGRQQTAELTVEEQRKLGLSEEQILKIAQARREIEKERERLDKQLEAARAAATAANAQVSKLNQDVRTLLTVRITKVYESVMNAAQLKEWKKTGFLEQAKQYLRGYKQWLKLSDAQVEDIAQLLVPVYEKYDKIQSDLEGAREELATLRKAEKLDIAAIEKAEKKVAELSKTTVYRERYNELRDAMRAGLMPDQLEKFDKYGRRR